MLIRETENWNRMCREIMNKKFAAIFRLKVKKCRSSSSSSSLKKRSKVNSIFTPMSVAHVDDEDAGVPTNSGKAEKVFSNGDFYAGQCHDNLPHGHGKFIWNDGCVYVGEWQNGKSTGKGRFIWSSGATYEGDFKDGFMDGDGAYIGSNGDSFRGFWLMNLKTGQGVKKYANGDFYEGDWKNDVQDGQGRYQWANGHCYVGQWVNGSFHGEGTLNWANGNKYEGNWEDGVPKGEGSFTFANGSFYAGVWNKDIDEKNVTYYPIDQGLEEHEAWDYRDLYLVELNECKISPGEMIIMYPSHKIENLKVEIIGKVPISRSKKTGRRSIDGRFANGNGGGISKGLRNSVEGLENLRINGHTSRKSHPLVLPKTIKKQGETICKGHKNYDLMLNLQLGIRHSVGRPGPAIPLDLKSSAFDPREKVWTRFPTDGSKHTPPHSSCDFKWKDYCPLVFRTLRKMFKVDPAEYMLSICGNDALRELSSPGKSGSFFYLTHDDKYMIKTVKKAEVKVLLRMLPAYYKHVRTHEDTLVTRFFGLHCVKVTGNAQKKVRFVIMGNLFCTDYAIHRRFDLKGSSHGRTTDKPESQIDPTITLKDLDLNYIFRLDRFWFQEFCRQVDRDCDFLEQERIMDYSLLVGLHFRDSCTKPLTKENGNIDSESVAPRLSRVDETDKLVFDASQWESIILGINMPARAEVTRRKTDCDAQLVGESTGECYEVILFFGIIDILQDYDISKRLEHAYKSIQYDPTSISAVDPKQYSRRFRDFIYKVFREDT